MAYAGICVEVSPNSAFPSAVEVVGADGFKYTQRIEYELASSDMSTLFFFWHRNSSCPKAVRQEWRPKSSNPDVIVASDPPVNSATLAICSISKAGCSCYKKQQPGMVEF